VLQTSKDTGSISAKSAPLTSRELHESGKGFRRAHLVITYAPGSSCSFGLDICLRDSSRLKAG